MNIGLGIGIPFAKSQIWLSLFDPSKLFTSGVNGAWYDPSDINLTWRRNLLTYSEQFDNAAWIKGNATITANAVIAPDGSMTADKLVPNTTNNQHTVGQVLPSNSYTYSVYVKAGEYNLLSISVYDGLSWKLAAIFNAASGAIERSFAGSATILSAGSGWYKCTVSGATSATATFNLQVTNSITDWASSFAGDGYSGIYIWGAQLEQGSTATPYQRITDGIQDYLQYQAQPVLYRDAAGTQPVTAVEQPVGLILDKSGTPPAVWLQKIADPTLSTTAGWSNPAVFSGGKYISGSSSYSLTATVGKLYRYTYVVSQPSTGGLALYVCGVQKGTSSPIAAGTYTGTVLATNTKVFEFYDPGWGWTGQIDSVSVEELQGNHAFNPSGNSANFPVLSARVNLLTKTEDFSAATGVWLGAGSTGATTLNFVVGADKYQYISGLVSGVSYVISFDLELISGGPRLYVNLQGASRKTVTATSTLVRVSITQTAVTANGYLIFEKFDTGSFKVTNMDVRPANTGVNLPTYQRVNTSSDYDTIGFKPYLRFNGTNQWLQTNSIDFSYSDKMFVCAGVRKLSSSDELIAELGTSYTSQGGSYLASNVGGNTVFTGRGNRSGTNGDDAIVSTPSPITCVFSGALAINAGTPATIRANGVNGTPSTNTTFGGGNYGNYPLYIGARAGSSLWFNGRLYGMVVAGKQASAAEIQDTEKYMNLKTAAYN